MSDSAPSTTLFGGTPYQTSAASQGTVMLYKDSSCTLPLTDDATPVLNGQCLPMPLSGIKSIQVDQLPACDSYGSPLLLISDQGGCKNSTQGTVADWGVTGKCQSFSSGVDIQSAEWACFGRGVSSVGAASSTFVTVTTSGNPYQVPPTVTETQGSSQHDDDSDSGCCGDGCCCVIM